MYDNDKKYKPIKLSDAFINGNERMFFESYQVDFFIEKIIENLLNNNEFIDYIPSFISDGVFKPHDSESMKIIEVKGERVKFSLSLRHENNWIKRNFETLEQFLKKNTKNNGTNVLLVNRHHNIKETIIFNNLRISPILFEENFIHIVNMMDVIDPEINFKKKWIENYLFADFKRLSIDFYFFVKGDDGNKKLNIGTIYENFFKEKENLNWLNINFLKDRKNEYPKRDKYLEDVDLLIRRIFKKFKENFSDKSENQRFLKKMIKTLNFEYLFEKNNKLWKEIFLANNKTRIQRWINEINHDSGDVDEWLCWEKNILLVVEEIWKEIKND